MIKNCQVALRALKNSEGESVVSEKDLKIIFSTSSIIYNVNIKLADQLKNRMAKYVPRPTTLLPSPLPQPTLRSNKCYSKMSDSESEGQLGQDYLKMSETKTKKTSASLGSVRAPYSTSPTCLLSH